MTLKIVDDLREIELPRHSGRDGELVVIEHGRALPFTPSRLFNVRAPQGVVRGRHAHKKCTQFLVCVHGSIEVECDDGARKARFLLDRSDKGLLIPPSIWASETYLVQNSVLTVLCDRVFEEEDYLRDYDRFLEWRREGQ